MSRADWRRPPLKPLKEGVRRFAITISYDGGVYAGWQVQNDAITVEGEIEKALQQMLGEKIVVEGSGRTDSGVHALGQVAHFDITNPTIPSRAFLLGLNGKLPLSIRILSCHEVDGTFHARFTAMAREYCYSIKRVRETLPFDAGYVLRVRELPDLDLLNSYAKYLVGTHDFTTFTSSGDICPSKWRDIYESYWTMEKDRYGYDVLTYTICGNAFLYHMVRSLVGTQLEFANKQRPSSDFRDILEKKQRSLCGRTADSCGLYLKRISYDSDEYAWFEEDERWQGVKARSDGK